MLSDFSVDELQDANFWAGELLGTNEYDADLSTLLHAGDPTTTSQ